MALIEFKNISKIYKQGEVEFKALDNVSIKIEKGEFVAVMGASGAGKSTLLNIIGCMDIPSKGEYYLEDKLIKDVSKRELARIRNENIGFIFQYFALMKDYSVKENVELPLTYRKISKRKIHEKSISMLEKVGIKDQIKKKPPQLSGGQQQRVAIARALIGEPSIILADEPTGALDEKNGGEIINMLKDINSEGKTVIIVTHNPAIANVCDRIIYIKDGKIDKNNK